MKNIIIIIIIIIIIFIFLGLFIYNKSIKNNDAYIKGNDLEYLSCLEEQLGAHFVSEKTSLKNLSIDNIIKNSDKVKYYRGFYTDDSNEFVIMKSDDSDTIKEFDNYFYNKYEKYQTFMFESDIRIYAHRTYYNIDFNEINNSCNNN